TAAVVRRGDAWFVGDDTGALPILPTAATRGVGDRRNPRAANDPLTMLLALSGGGLVDMTLEWTPHGVIPLAVHLDQRSIDIGPRADISFVGAA
ncbi:MAG: hypothetical protein GY901_01755, partial [Actinomycetia bacterium]|nr:hypothetical protein [Actinomycetes bacterium]